MAKRLMSRWVLVASASIALALCSGGGASAQDASRQLPVAVGTPQASGKSVPKQDAAQLRDILRQNNSAQFTAYVQAFDHELMLDRRPLGPLDPDIERVIVEYFHTSQWQKPLMHFVSLRPYSSRALFDLLYEHIRDPDKVDPNLHWYNLICNTSQPNIEAPLLAAVPQLGTDGQDVILFCLSGRKYAPAVPAIMARIGETRGTNTTMGMRGYELLANIGNKEAADALVSELKRIHRMPSPTAADLAAEEAVLRALSSVPKETPLDSALIVGLISGKSHAVRQGYLQFLNARPDPAAASDLIGYLSDDTVRAKALDVLYHMEAPEVWSRAMGTIEALHAAGKLPDANYRYAKQLLSQRIEHPEALRQEQIKAAANQAVQQEAAAVRSYGPSSALMQTDPRRYVEQAMRSADALEAVAERHPDAPYSVGVRVEVFTERWNVALLQRFVLRQPPEAIETNQKIVAAEARQARTNDLNSTLQIAEIYQHELSDKAKALEYYQKARAAVDAQDWNGVRDPDIVKTWFKKGLIDREISFLMTGRAFSGTVTRRDIEGSGVNLLQAAGVLAALGMPQMETGGGSEAAAWKSTVLNRLREAPPSYLTTTATILLVSMTGTDAAGLPDTLNRSDPVHYVSACMLGAAAANASHGAGQETQGGASQKKGATSLHQAIARFEKANDIEIRTEADPRRATPQATWDLFIASLKRGDRETAADCFSGPLRTSLTELFRKSSDADLLRMANEFGPLQGPATGIGSEFQEFGITRKGAQGARAALVYFVRVDDEWLVQSM